ncbi:uncharacterized protein LOC125427684 [Sphaerodactylus townsendi]|uniref:uncharacterized protein LOC125427684 n=1 Tax=Sphaerodactylus townsendi TaxID=933632 RepID=UPI0020269B58|nr:uncharacterized protein LOC125427684 [Sphaerodactylus townsendi]
MMKMEQRKKPSIPSFQRLEDTQAVPDVHSEFPEGMTEVKDQEESWDHQVVEENMAVPRACSEFPEGMTEVKDEEESWDHQAVEENNIFPSTCSGVSNELPEGMTEVKDEEESWDYQAVEENKTVPTACSEFPEGMTKVKVEEDSWDHQAVEENKNVPAACLGFPVVKVEPEEEPSVSDFHAEETGTVLDVQSGEKQLVCEATTMEHRQPKKRESGAARRKRLKLAAEEAKKSSHMELRQEKESGVAGQTRLKLAVEEAKKGRKRQNLAAEEAMESSQMEHSQQKKNESEAQEQKRLKLTAEEATKPRQLIFIFFKKPLSAPSNQSQATSESVEMEEDEEILPEETETVDTSEPGEPEGVEECLSAMPEVILKHDVGLLPFNKVTQRPRISDALRTQMVQMGSRYFQNSEGPFKPTPPQNRRMSKRWFKVRLGDGQGKEVTRSWLMYSPSKRTAFCFCLLFSRSEVQSALERESGFGQWKKYDRITSHENGRNHRECFTQWKEMEKNLAMSREIIDTDLQTPIEKERQKWRDKHWAKLQEAVPLSLESQSETRWSAKAEAVKPLRMHLEDIIELLQNMEDDREETDASRREAKVLVSCLLSYDFLSYVGFWDKVLGRIDLVQRRLRNPRMNFHYAAQDLRSLQYHFDANRDILVSESIDDGISLCQKFNVEFECFRRYRKTMPLVKAREAGLTEIKEMERSMKAVLDHLHREINESFTRLHNIDTKFGFLLDIEKLCYGTDIQDLQEKCVNLGNFYSSDIDGQKLYHDILDCRMLLSGQDEVRISSPEQLLEFIVQFGDESAFFNLTVAIQILLTIAVSIASCELNLFQ